MQVTLGLFGCGTEPAQKGSTCTMGEPHCPRIHRANNINRFDQGIGFFDGRSGHWVDVITLPGVIDILLDQNDVNIEFFDEGLCKLLYKTRGKVPS